MRGNGINCLRIVPYSAVQSVVRPFMPRQPRQSLLPGQKIGMAEPNATFQLRYSHLIKMVKIDACISSFNTIQDGLGNIHRRTRRQCIWNAAIISVTVTRLFPSRYGCVSMFTPCFISRLQSSLIGKGNLATAKG